MSNSREGNPTNQGKNHSQNYKTANVDKVNEYDIDNVVIRNPRRSRGAPNGNLTPAQVAGIQRAVWAAIERNRKAVSRKRDEKERIVSERRQQQRVYSNFGEEVAETECQAELYHSGKKFDHKLIVAANMRNKVAKRARKHKRREIVTEGDVDLFERSREAWEEAVEEHKYRDGYATDDLKRVMSLFNDGQDFKSAKDLLGKYGWFINDFITVIATLILSRKADDFSSQLSLATLFANSISIELGARDKVITVTLVFLMQRVFNSFKSRQNVVVTEGIAETIEDFASNLRSIKDGAFIMNMRNLLVTTAALRLFDKDIAINIFKYLGKPQGVDNVDLVSQALMGIAQLVRYYDLIRNKTVGLSELLFRGDPIDNAIREGRRLLALRTDIYVGSKVEGGIHQRDFMDRALKVLPILSDVLAKANPFTSSWKACNDVYALLNPFVTEIKNRIKGSQRMAPWCVCIASEPGVGKSTWISWVARVASDAAGRKFTEDQIYHRTKGSEYWEVYNGWNHPFVHFSEIADDTPDFVKKNGDEVMTELTGLVDNCPKTVNSAFGDKNKNYFFSEGILMDTNNLEHKLNIKYYKNNPAAFLRRILFINVRVLSQYKKEGTCGIDPTKGRDKRLMDKFEVDIYLEQQLNNTQTSRLFLAHGVNIDKCYDILFDYFTTHTRTQSEIVGLKGSDVDVVYGKMSTRVAESNLDDIEIDEKGRFVPEYDEKGDKYVHTQGDGDEKGRFVPEYDEKGDRYDHTQVDNDEKKEPDPAYVYGTSEYFARIRADHARKKQESDERRKRLRAVLMTKFHYINNPVEIGRTFRLLPDITYVYACTSYAYKTADLFFRFIWFSLAWLILACFPSVLVGEFVQTGIDIIRPSLKIFGYSACYLLFNIPGLALFYIIDLVLDLCVYPFIIDFVTLRKWKDTVNEQIERAKNNLIGSFWSDSSLMYAGVGVGVLVSAAYAISFAKGLWDGYSFQRGFNREYYGNHKVAKATEGNTNFHVQSEYDEKINVIEERIGAERAQERRKGQIPDAWVVQTVKRPIVHTGTAETLEGAISRNCRLAVVEFDGKKHRTCIFGVKADMALINRHMLPISGKFIIRVNMTGVRYNDDNYRETTGYVERSVIVDQDVVLVRLSQMQFADVSKHFTDADFNHARGVICGRDINVRHNALREMKARDAVHDQVTVKNPVIYEWEHHQPGACGSPIVVSFGKNAAIIGIHFAGDMNSKTAYGVRVTASAVEKACTLMSTQSVLMPVVSQTQGFVSLEAPHKRSPFQYENLHNVEYIGYNGMPVNMNNNSALTKSEIASKVDDILAPLGRPRKQVFVPPLLKPKRKGLTKEYINPFTTNLKKLNTIKKSLDPVILETVITSFVDHVVRSLDGKLLHPLILEEAINGALNDDYIRRINVRTGSGYGFSGKKYKHLPISLEEEGKLVREPTPELRKRLAERMSEFIDKRETSVSIFGAKLKDEPRLIEKVIQGKTRMFFPSPIDLLIISRSVLAPFFTLMVERNDVFRCAVGIDMFSQGQDFYEALLAFADGDDMAGFEGDYGGFDTSMPFEIGHAASSVVYRVCERLGYNDASLKLLSGVLSDNLYPYVEVNGDIMGVPGLMTSGSYGTAEFNCIRNVILMMYFFESHANLTLDDFYNKLYVRTYGDDVVGIVHRDIKEQFNCVTYSNFCKEVYGMDFTTSDKCAVNVPFVQVSKLSFLKRTFRMSDYGRIFAVLDTESIYKMLTWTEPSDYVSRMDQLVSCCNSALYEIFMWTDKETFYKIRNDLDTAVKESLNCYDIDLVGWVKIAQNLCPEAIQIREEESGQFELSQDQSMDLGEVSFWN